MPLSLPITRSRLARRLSATLGLPTPHGGVDLCRRLPTAMRMVFPSAGGYWLHHFHLCQRAMLLVQKHSPLASIHPATADAMSTHPNPLLRCLCEPLCHSGKSSASQASTLRRLHPARGWPTLSTASLVSGQVSRTVCLGDHNLMSSRPLGVIGPPWSRRAPVEERELALTLALVLVLGLESTQALPASVILIRALSSISIPMPCLGRFGMTCSDLATPAHVSGFPPRHQTPVLLRIHRVRCTRSFGSVSCRHHQV